MKREEVRTSKTTRSAWCLAIAAGATLSACSTSDTYTAAPAPAPAQAQPVATAPNHTPPPLPLNPGATHGSIDMVSMELASGRDPIVGSGEHPPSSFAATGAGLQGMALDVMESLAQVTFAKQGSDFDPSLSRDGQTLVFASTQHRPTSDIYVKNVTGRTVTQLTADPGQDVMPSISPDGTRVAFASNRSGSWDIYVMSIKGGQAVQLTNDPAQELHASWSPDGSKLVYCRLGQVSGRWEMWVTDTEQPMVNEFIGYGLLPAWCPVEGSGDDGRDKIVFQRSRERGDRAFSVWTVDYKPGDASSPTEIASSTSAACINPTWSPDGEWVVFATVGFNGNTSTNAARPSLADLWMCSVDGSGRVNLTTGRSVNLMPSWGADGRIYFVSDRGGIENIWSIGTEKAILAATGGRGRGSPMQNSDMEAKHGDGASKEALTTVPDEQEKPSH